MSKKFPCALLINDIHASKDNIAEFRKNWDEALELCKQVICGFHEVLKLWMFLWLFVGPY